MVGEQSQFEMEGEHEMEGYSSVDSSIGYESDCDCISPSVAPCQVELPTFTASEEDISSTISSAADSLET
jgi:hypothetical protein